MHYVSWILNQPREVLVGAVAIFFLLVFWIWVRFGHRQLVVVKQSDATQLITYELGRIADALDRLSSLPPPRETLRPTEAGASQEKRISMSMFGR